MILFEMILGSCYTLILFDESSFSFPFKTFPGVRFLKVLPKKNGR